MGSIETTPPRLAVVGDGLIGRSVRLAWLRRYPDAEVTSLDRGGDLGGLLQADLVVLAAPVDAIVGIIPALPRLAHWQHYGPRGSYASALEPFHGSLLGSARESDPRFHPTLQPGEVRRYRMRLTVLHRTAELRQLLAGDAPLKAGPA